MTGPGGLGHILVTGLSAQLELLRTQKHLGCVPASVSSAHSGTPGSCHPCSRVALPQDSPSLRCRFVFQKENINLTCIGFEPFLLREGMTCRRRSAALWRLCVDGPWLLRLGSRGREPPGPVGSVCTSAHRREAHTSSARGRIPWPVAWCLLAPVCWEQTWIMGVPQASACPGRWDEGMINYCVSASKKHKNTLKII